MLVINRLMRSFDFPDVIVNFTSIFLRFLDPNLSKNLVIGKLIPFKEFPNDLKSIG